MKEDGVGVGLVPTLTAVRTEGLGKRCAGRPLFDIHTLDI
jgi:hypothetical protein